MNPVARCWRLTVKVPAAIDPWPDEVLDAIFETQGDAEAAGDLVRRIYRGQRFQIKIEEW